MRDFRVVYLYDKRTLEGIQIWDGETLCLDTTCDDTPQRDNLESLVRGAREYDIVDPYRPYIASDEAIIDYYKEHLT
jgi:hypothetical protein